MEIDSIIEDMAGAFAVSENNIHDEHPRFSHYKNEGKIASNQRQRRKQFLERQSQARESYRNRIRAIYFSNFNEDAILPEKEDHNKSEVQVDDAGKKRVENLDSFAGSDTTGFEEMDFVKWGIKSKGLKKPKIEKQDEKEKHSFTGYLMFSEWLVDIPQLLAFSTEWMMLPCPIGKRSLLVAHNGFTSVYNKSGYRLAQFQSDFPGGSRADSKSCTLLDCILDKVSKRYFVLDLLCWNSSHFVDTEFINRRQFLYARFSEMPELSEGGRSSGGGYSFHVLPSCSCTIKEMTELMLSNFDYDLDGLLFYYSKVMYTPGQTPLVGWLKPWMMPEILNVDVPMKYVGEQGFFSSSKQFIERYNKKHNFKSSIAKDSNNDLGDQSSSAITEDIEKDKMQN